MKLNDYKIREMVRMKGLEPPRLAAQEPKSCMSTSFITSAYGNVIPSSALLLGSGLSVIARKLCNIIVRTQSQDI